MEHGFAANGIAVRSYTVPVHAQMAVLPLAIE